MLAGSSEGEPGNVTPQPPSNQFPNSENDKEKDMPDATPRISRVKMLSQVINVLQAYLETFGRPESDVDFRAVIGAIVANLTTVQVKNERLEGFIDEVIAAYGSVDSSSAIVDTTTQLLAEQVAVWLREQEVTVENVVSAYLQEFAPIGETWDAGRLIALVQTVVATLNDGALSSSGGRSLVAKVIGTFELDKALSRRIGPEWIALAQRIASYVRTGSVQLEVRSIAWSYLRQFQAILSPQLIEQIMTEGPVNLSPADVFSGDLGEFSQMLYYKFQLLEADPVVTKSHDDIAAQVRRAVEDFKLRRGIGLDLTKPEETGDLEVSSSFIRS
ncbi:MAG: hypothetical protein AAF703_04905 [Cyanobacteria bacterium P01_D01_bin.105]